MAFSSPLDHSLRERLKAAKPNQAEFSRAIGRSAGWLNKYMHGAGTATIDDAVRIVALLIGVETSPLSELERRVVKALRAIPEERREDAAVVLESVAKTYRHARHPESAAPRPDTQRAIASRARGSR